MILCSEECDPCCDFCIYAIQDVWVDADGDTVSGGPIGCNLHSDKEHQEIAEYCGCCDDFHCALAEEGKEIVKHD